MPRVQFQLIRLKFYLVKTTGKLNYIVPCLHLNNKLEYFRHPKITFKFKFKSKDKSYLFDLLK